MVGWNNNNAVYIASSKSYERKRFVSAFEQSWTKQEQQLNQFHCYNQNMDLVDRMDQNVAQYRTDIRMKE